MLLTATAPTNGTLKQSDILNSNAPSVVYLSLPWDVFRQFRSVLRCGRFLPVTLDIINTGQTLGARPLVK